MSSTRLKPTSSIPAATNGAIKHLEEAIIKGKHWYIALLEAIGTWPLASESHNGRTYQYLIGGEAFDWLLLAERLCQSVDSLLPEDEKTALLFEGKPPLELTVEKFKGLIGQTKHQQCLNYFYGITVEEALILAAEEEVCKERYALGFNKKHDTTSEAFQRIYGLSQLELLKQFRQEKGRRQGRSISLAELKEFTYWLFKYRLKHCDRARVASDTKKALKRLHNTALARGQAACWLPV